MDTLIATVPIAVITFDFDPYVQLFGDLTVRWGSIALVGAIVAALVLAGLLARAGGLRPDDVAFVAVGIVPGAVIGARLGYLIVHAQTFGSAPERLLDPSIGGLELGLAVVGGFLTGSYVASLLGPSVGRWLHLAALPVLFVLGAGKLTMVLTGTGQGLPSDADWATAYLGPGPWGSLVPGPAVEPVAGLRGPRDPGRPGDPDRGRAPRRVRQPRRTAVLRRDRAVGRRPCASFRRPGAIRSSPVASTPAG